MSNGKMVVKNQNSIGSGSPLNFTQVLEKYKSLISVIAPYNEGGALRVELSDRIDSGDWKTLAYKGGLFTSNYHGKYTYYIKASNADETVAQLKALGIAIPDVDYKGKGASSASPKVEAKPVSEAKPEAKPVSKQPTKKQIAQAKKLLKMVESMKEMGITNAEQLKDLF